MDCDYYDKKQLKNNNTKGILNKIKSIFFIKIIFEILNNIIKYPLIKYNKNLQNKLNISLKNYKEYYETLSPIEIELKIKKNNYGKFINLDNFKKIQVYFDNEKEKKDRNYLNHNENVKIIKIIIEDLVISFEYLFFECNCIESITFKRYYRNNIKINGMFSGCKSVKQINLLKMNTSNAIDMSYMFDGCSSLKQLELFKLNTLNVTNMSHMFYGCSSLQEIDLSKFNTLNVTDMSHMFNGCSSLEYIDVSKFSTDKVNNMSYMFSCCSSLNSIIIIYGILHQGLLIRKIYLMFIMTR